ncbi:MAG: TetR/AcrR family transcriptional regulator [bacterium]
MGNAEESSADRQNAGKRGAVRSQSEAKLDRLLEAAASLMARQGYAQTSIRNVALETGFSLAGMYYYFENKEDLLFQIQHRAFSSLLQLQDRAMAEGGSAEAKLRRLVQNHLAYFTDHFNELKVCTYELDSLKGERYSCIEQLRRQYFGYHTEVIKELLGLDETKPGAERLLRHYTLFVFGMQNWIFTWYNHERDAPAEQLGQEMMALLLNGLGGELPLCD